MSDKSGTITVELDKRLLVGIGDLHGHYPALRELLSALDAHYRIFDDAPELIVSPEVELVFTGDYIDRGAESRKVIDTCMNMKAMRPHDVYQLFGNHELMALTDLDTARAISSRGNALAYYSTYTSHGHNGGDVFVREFGDGNSALADYAEAMSRDSPIGDWLRSLDAVRKVGVHGKKLLFVHGGIPYTIVDRQDLRDYKRRFDERIAQKTVTFSGSEQKYDSELTSDHSVFWDRRIPKGIDETDLREMTEDLGVDFIVIGHTPQKQIVNYFDMAFNIDVGMTPRYGGNEPAAIVFKPEGVFAFYARRGEELLVQH